MDDDARARIGLVEAEGDRDAILARRRLLMIGALATAVAMDACSQQRPAPNTRPTHTAASGASDAAVVEQDAEPPYVVAVCLQPMIYEEDAEVQAAPLPCLRR